jgi:hypothetical protein
MSRVFPTILRRAPALAAFGALLAGALMIPGPAQARVFVGFGFPLVVGPPAYYPPPAADAPRPGGPPGQACYAGGTVCPMERPVGSGSSCYCTTARGRVWGRAS